MKKSILVLLACLLTTSALLTGCDKPPASSSEPEPNTSSTEPAPPPMVADAALYRGEITEAKDGSLVIAQVPGRIFGPDELTVLVDENTHLETPFTDLAVGDYIEVYYGRSPSGAPPTEVTAILINKLMPAEAVMLYAKVTDFFLEDGKLKSISIETAKGEPIVFRVDDNTQIYLTVADLKVGDELSIYHSGILAESYPAQGFALEVAPFAASAA